MGTRMRGIVLACLMAGTVLAGCAAEDTETTTSTSRVVTTRPSTTTPVTTLPTTVPTTVPTTTTTTTQPMTTTTTTTSTGPDLPPYVNETSILAVTPHTAQVYWNVSDDHDKVFSRVEFGIGAGNHTRVTPDQPGNGPHMETLSGLRSCTTYGYRVSAQDEAGHETIVTAVPATFRTTGSAPRIPVTTATNVMHTSMSIRWNVTGPSDMVSQVQYGSTPDYGHISQEQTGPGSKVVSLSGLSTNTVYNFRIRVTSPCGNVDGPNLMQRTAELIHVDINAAAGSANSFTPGSTVAGDLDLVAGRPYVFEVKNKDTTAHTFNIETVSPAYNSGNIPAGVTYYFQSSITLGAGTYQMRCSFHYTGASPMTGTIDVR